jgi:hypothetical protein
MSYRKYEVMYDSIILNIIVSLMTRELLFWHLAILCG